MMIKGFVKSFLLRRGLELKPIGAPVRGPNNYIQHLRAKGFSPRTVIDIGVATGTPWLYQFPDAKLVLIEANDQFMPDLERIKQQRQADVFVCAAGSGIGQLSLHVDQFAPSSSSFYRVSEELNAYWQSRGQQRDFLAKTVDVKPLDDLLEDRYQSPFLIKMDIEGYELEALRGAIKTLEKTKILIVEVSVAKRHDGADQFADLVQFLAVQNFHFSDIIDVAVSSSNGDISYMDIAFTRNDDPMRDRPGDLH